MCFHWSTSVFYAMKQENDARNIVGSLQIVKMYTFMKVIKLYILALYSIFLFVKTEVFFL